ncbi:MAG: HDOD domain-containing protein [Dehalococcoidia bacterium]|nr:HDOD domain-containing protein [Dehalococcoidia bacterium]
MNANAAAALDQMVHDIAELRPLAAAATRVLQITEGDTFSAHELAQAISADQALTARLLRLSNSAYYGFPRRITTVRDAVVLLGFRAVRSATLASSVIDALPGSTTVDYQQMWRYSVTVGMLAEVLARAHRRHLEEAFTAGVLHNIGRLALDQHRPELLNAARRYAEREDVSVTEAELRLFEFTDAELGGALARHWNFPDELADAVEWHAQPLEALTDHTSIAADIVRARLFARSLRITDGVEGPQGEQADRSWSQPPVAGALAQAGGVAGIQERVAAFVDNALHG